MNAPAQLSRAECAAILITLLDDDEASALLARLDPLELEKVGGAMCELGEIEPARIAAAIANFASEADSQVLAGGDREERVEKLFEASLGPLKAQSMMQRIRPTARPRSIEMARWLAPTILYRMIEDEHPQVIAALLLMLEAEPAAEILTMLPEESQPAVVERIARMGPVSSGAVDMIDQLLSLKIGQRFGASALEIGGPKEAANLINLAAGQLGQTIIPAIAQRDEDLARQIEEEMFTFEMLFELEPLPMGRLLRDVENEILVDALKGISEEQREHFFAAMSSRAADGVKDEIEMRGRISKADTVAAQRKVVEIARGLVDQGEIIMGAGDDEFV